ncbi:MAG: D-alanyl-D-alanine carboxypeptidase [Acidimicrobiia bacterium]|nr:D-alanyl-D-alanine carboxypeptidase [Acidimicrobiia bacterium]
MRKLVLILIALMFVAHAPAVAQDLPPPTPDLLFAAEPPEVTAITWILYDDTFGRVLAADSPDARRAIASTTKIMTALVALQEGTLTDVVVISDTADAVGESEIGLVAGEEWLLQDLITAMLIRSANDASVAIAEYIGGSVEGFADLMNIQVRRLGLENSQFVNPHGLDEPGHYSSAADLLVIARKAMENPVFAGAVQTQVARMQDDPEGNERIAIATNKLLEAYPGAIGVKTGFTNNAGLTLVAAAERDDRRLYAVVLGSEDHFADATALLDYGFDEFGVVQLVAAGDAYANRRSAGLFDEAVASASFDLFLGPEAAGVAITPIYDEGGPVIVAELDGEELGRVALEVDDPPPLPDLRDAFAWASRYWDWVWGNG